MTYYSHPQQNKNISRHYAPADILSPSQHDTAKVNLPLLLMDNHKEILLQMQKTDPFWKCITKWLPNGKAPHHKADTFTHINSPLYKHAMVATQKFLVLIIPKSWHFTVLVEAHDKLGHQGTNRTYHLIKNRKRMNKDINKYIANCTLCKREKAKMQMYPLQMIDIPDWPFNKISIDLIKDLSVSTSGIQHILTIIDHSWQKADTIVPVLINNYLPIHMCPRFILSDNG